MDMKRWDHLDVVIAVGVCATILGAGMFFFSFGGAPAGFSERFADMTPTFIDQEGIAQVALGEAIVDAEKIRQLEGTTWGVTQERLGQALVTSFQAHQARAGLVPYFREAARNSLDRMYGMIQESAGRAVVAATQRMWRAGMTETAQLEFIEALGGIRAAMILKERSATPLRQEALGWTVVGRVLSLDRMEGHAQELLGSALRDAGVMTARLETGKPLSQESLGSAILVASAAQDAVSTGNLPSMAIVSAPGVSGIQALRDIPYPAGVLILAGLFVMIWGIRSVAESGPTLPTYETPSAAEERYRKVG